MPSLSRLNDRLALGEQLRFEAHASGLPMATVRTPQATARVALHGGQVLAWQPDGQRPVLWLSPAAVFESGTPVRGGIPVCWPWFGSLPGQGAHGFVRTRLWEVRATELDDAGQVVLRLGTRDDAASRAVWNHAFELELVITVGPSLTLALTSRNTGTEPFTLSEALHSYFCVGDIHRTRVLGLDGCDYLDKVQNFAPKVQSGRVQFSGETDRIYRHATSECLIEDEAWGRTLRIRKQGSRSTVVWNPWAEREASIADMARGDHRGMLCVETGNAGPDPVTLAPGEQHTLSACLSVL